MAPMTTASVIRRWRRCPRPSRSSQWTSATETRACRPTLIMLTDRPTAIFAIMPLPPADPSAPSRRRIRYSGPDAAPEGGDRRSPSLLDVRQHEGQGGEQALAVDVGIAGGRLGGGDGDDVEAVVAHHDDRLAVGVGRHRRA